MALRKNSSQRAGQLGTSRPSNSPAARLNLQFCSAVRLKEAAWKAHLSLASSDLIFLGWWWEGIGGVEGLIGLPRCFLESRTTEADGSETSVCSDEKNKGLWRLHDGNKTA